MFRICTVMFKWLYNVIICGQPISLYQELMDILGEYEILATLIRHASMSNELTLIRYTSISNELARIGHSSMSN
jgi:hypothetical protein